MYKFFFIFSNVKNILQFWVLSLHEAYFLRFSIRCIITDTCLSSFLISKIVSSLYRTFYYNLFSSETWLTLLCNVMSSTWHRSWHCSLRYYSVFCLSTCIMSIIVTVHPDTRLPRPKRRMRTFFQRIHLNFPRSFHRKTVSTIAGITRPRIE